MNRNRKGKGITGKSNIVGSWDCSRACVVTRPMTLTVFQIWLYMSVKLDSIAIQRKDSDIGIIILVDSQHRNLVGCNLLPVPVNIDSNLM